MRWSCITINEQFYDVDYWIPALARGAKPRLLGRNDGHGCLALAFAPYERDERLFLLL